MGEEKEFEMILQVIVSRLAHEISGQMNLSDKVSLDKLYSSKLYEKLENEETKVWHFSVPTLLSLFIEEQETGKLTFPEEG